MKWLIIVAAITGLLILDALTELSLANSLILFDYQNKAIGYLYGNGSNYCANGGFAVISRTGYFACVNNDGHLDGQIYPPGGMLIGYTWYFLSTDCTSVPEYLLGQADGGAVVSAYTLGIIMVSKGQTSIPRTFYSNEGSGGCFSIAGGTGLTAKSVSATSNDPTVTGIFDGPYAPPMSLQVVPDSVLTDEIYFDSFEFAGDF